MSQEKQSSKRNKIPFFQLYNLASKKDVVLIVLGMLSALGNGMIQPLFGQLFGNMAEEFSPQNTPDEVLQACIVLTIYFIIVGICERQVINLRLACYQSLIQQDISYFDNQNGNELSQKIASDCMKIQYAIGDKICMYVYTLSMIAGGLLISFLRGWQIALVSSIIIPILFYSSKFMTWVSNGVTMRTSTVYQEAGGRVEQALSSIRTVKSMNGEQYEGNQFNSLISKVFKVSLKYSVFTGIAFGIQNMLLFFDFSLIFWVGSLFIEDEVINQNMKRHYIFSDVLVVFLSLFFTSNRLNGATDSIKYFEEAKIAGYDIFEILNRKSEISQNQIGLKIMKSGKQYEIRFENVKFSYPNRKDINILKGLTFTLQSKKRTAIVGKSGCGKSTIIQLLERFYNPSEGNIFIDDIDISSYDLNQLRQAIGYVSQEPVLFSTTIRENLKFAKSDATEDEMIAALQKANVWSFVDEQEKKLDTFVGQNGTQLSGGQKQRICIARAILKKPKILLLDEATSALDSKNEALVQKTLDQVAEGITTIIVAHRLSTIKNADDIIVIDNGTLIERGTHSYLMEQKGYYYELVKKQEESKEDNVSYLKNQQQEEAQKDLVESNLKKESECLLKNQENLPTLNTQRQLTLIDQDLNLRKTAQNLSINLMAPPSLNTQTQLMSIENDLLKQQSVKLQIINLQSEQLITELKTETCELNTNPYTNYNGDYFTSRQEYEAIQDKKEEENAFKSNYTFGQMIKKLLSYNQGQSFNVSMGILFSIGNGIAYPLSGWVFGNIASVLLDPEVDNFREKSNKYSLYFAIIGVADLFSLFFQYYFQSKVSERLTYTLRCDLFNKMLRMPISWFDRAQNHSSALAQSVDYDCKQVNVLVSTTITFNIANISSLLSGIILGLTADWRTTLVGICLVPLIIFTNILSAVKMNGYRSKMNETSGEAAKLISESTCFIRTVASLGNPSSFCDSFKRILEMNTVHIQKSAFSAGIAQGFTNLAIFSVYGVIFMSGATFHKFYGVNIRDILISILCLMLATLGIGKNTQFMGDAGASFASAKKIFNTLENSDEQELNKGRVDNNSIKGEIIFEDVSFKYPLRESYVLKNVSFKIPAKSRVAFVGSSGSGKSTIMQLIQRFYTNYSGRILLDGVDLKSYDLQQYRSYFGVVSQEPVLFNGTIKENVIYNQQKITDEQIVHATKMANAYQFIENFIEGFDKRVGIRGEQISGGQKQRIAISRMILQQPQVMLLDEATSALDSQNEQIVQESLNKQMEGKTSISVAHRLSTIRESDIILVLENGQIVEQEFSLINIFMTLSFYFWVAMI